MICLIFLNLVAVELKKTNIKEIEYSIHSNAYAWTVYNMIKAYK